MKILVAEDNLKLAAAIKSALESQHYAVDIVNNGVDALDFAITEDYNVIILDIMMPQMDGLKVCQKLRQEKISTPVLMLTAKSQVSDKVTGLDTGADDYMAKPFSFDELFSRIRALTRRNSNDKDPISTVANLKIDPRSFKVTREKKDIKLSAKEFSILEYLIKNKGKVVSKDQIISNVWNFDADILPTTVEVHIKNLREKVDNSFGKKLIKTVRGFGYKIGDES